MKKTAILLAALVFLSTIPAFAQDCPAVSAASYIMIEPESGTVLAEHNADDRRLIASTTKIMTALVVLQDCDLSETVEIRADWTGIEGSSMYLRAGDCYTVEELLYGMMLVSGNDAATALACYAAGSVSGFAERMNSMAESLGCENTHFENACGLDGENHYSSARDLARITAATLQNADFVRIVSAKCKTIHGQSFYNHNKLLSRCEGVFGVKTGYTMAAGRTLVSACERQGMTLICVTLDDPNDWEDHEALYDWGFGRFEIVDASSLCGEFSVPVIGWEHAKVECDGSCRFVADKSAEIRCAAELPPFIFPGMDRGTKLGCVRFYSGGELLGESALYLAEDIPQTEQPLSRGESFRRFLFLAGRNIYSF